MSVKQNQIAKGLQTQISELEVDIQQLNIRLEKLKRERDQKASRLGGLRQKLRQVNNQDGIKISEHAMLRYFERVLGHNLKDVEQSILTPDLLKMTEVLGPNGVYPVKDFQVKMKDNTIVTILK